MPKKGRPTRRASASASRSVEDRVASAKQARPILNTTDGDGERFWSAEVGEVSVEPRGGWNHRGVEPRGSACAMTL